MHRTATATRITPIAYLVIVAALALGAPVNAQESSAIVGDWTGALQAGPATLRLRLAVEAGDEGLTAQLFSIDQGNQAIPVETIELSGTTLTFTSPAIGVSYEGKLNADGTAIEGTFSQWASRSPLALTKGEGEASAPGRPQDPEEPLRTTAKTSPSRTRTADTVWPGRSPAPEGAESHPAVVLITGSAHMTGMRP